MSNRRAAPIALPRTRRGNDPQATALYELVRRANEGSGGVGPQGPQGPQGAAGSSGGSSPAGPEFTYTSGVLTRIDYDDSSYKTFTYTSGKLTRIDFVQGATTTRKDFVYSGDTLVEINQTTL
jgi:hypothetical protein